MQNKRYYNFLIFACAFLWIMMMGSKNVYTAEIVELVDVFSVSESDVSMAMTYYFITYSVAQVIMFFFMDNINIKWFLGISMILSGVVTVFIALMTSMWQMWWLLAFNGILQAGVWGMCLAILKKYLPKEMLIKANTIMNVGMAIAGIISYGFASFFVGIGHWELPYYILGSILSISAVLFILAIHLCQKHCSKTEDVQEQVAETDKPIFNLKTGLSKAVFFISAFLFSVLIHSTYYMAMNWMPSMLEKIHNLDKSISILISVIAPIATIVGAVVAIQHCEKYKNMLIVALVYLAISTVFSLLMLLLFDVNTIPATLLTIVFLVLNQGVISITFGVLPLKIGNGINAGGLGCLMNAAGGFSAGFAPLIASYIFTGISWEAYYLVIFGITAILFAVILLVYLLTSQKTKV